MKIFVWIAGKDTALFQRAIALLVRISGKVEVEHFTMDGSGGTCTVAGKPLRFLPKEKVKEGKYDVILVVGGAALRPQVLAECRKLGVDESIVLFDFEVCIPAFTPQKSNKLHRSRISIFSVNGWGKKLCDRFRLPYLSPFIGTAMQQEDYLTFLESPREHLSKELVRQGCLRNADGTKYPVFSMGKDGPRVYLLDGTDVKGMQQRWKDGIKHINWSDILAMTYTDSPEILDRFDRLPYAKKICFTSFASRLDSAFHLPKEQDEGGNELPLWASVDRLVEGERPCYDLWDILLYGRRTSIRYQ